MPFFLLRTGPDGQLELLSKQPVPTRHEALAQLAEITSSPDYDRWDDEVFAIDLDNATPVLLVRPTPPAQTEVGESMEPTPLMAVSDEAESPSEAEGHTASADTPQAEVSADDEVVDNAAETGPTPVPMTFVAPEPSDEPDDGADERAQVAHDEAIADLQDDLELDEPADEPGEATVETADDDVAEPADEAEGDAELAAAVADVELDAELDALERIADDAGIPDDEPADEGDGQAEADTPSTTPEPVAVVQHGSPQLDESEMAESEGELESAHEEDPVPEPQLVEPSWPWTTLVVGDSEGEAGVVSADDVPDADEVVPAPPEPDLGPPPAGYQATANDVGDLTCDDCVYTDTCPNKDQREPSSCGSFQWK